MSSFQAGGTKLEIFLSKNQHTQTKLLKFENWCNGEVFPVIEAGFPCENAWNLNIFWTK